jgi:predicted Rossmann fold nucleotide-binding protein DprA/Smf involved in DNA uptake
MAMLHEATIADTMGDTEGRAQEPAAPPAPPEVDVDTWFAQRDQMISKLEARYDGLLNELEETRRKLEVLGVAMTAEEPEQEEEPAPRTTRTRAKRAQKKPLPPLKAQPPKTAQVLRALSKEPEKVTDIAKRAGLSYSETWRVLDTARRTGKVKCVGTKGKDVRWALVA